MGYGTHVLASRRGAPPQKVGLLLPLVVHYQKGLDGRFAAKVATLGAFTAWCLAAAPMRVVAATQVVCACRP